MSHGNWFRDHFNEDYLLLYAGRDQAEADREVEFAVERLGIRPSETVLDLCCGFGRHLRAFARRRIPAVGVDLSAALLGRARDEHDLLVRADMRRLPFRSGGEGEAAGFAVLVNFFTSFGYFENDADNAGVVREMARVLRPGGRFLLDLMNPESTVAGLEPRSRRSAGALDIEEERRFDAERRRIEKKITLTDTATGDARRYFESVKVYTLEELGGMLGEAGLEVTGVCGDFDGRPATATASRLIVNGRRSG